jgi:hypothetical protein
MATAMAMAMAGCQELEARHLSFSRRGWIASS